LGSTAGWLSLGLLTSPTRIGPARSVACHPWAADYEHMLGLQRAARYALSLAALMRVRKTAGLVCPGVKLLIMSKFTYEHIRQKIVGNTAEGNAITARTIAYLPAGESAGGATRMEPSLGRREAGRRVAAHSCACGAVSP